MKISISGNGKTSWTAVSNNNVRVDLLGDMQAKEVQVELRRDKFMPNNIVTKEIVVMQRYQNNYAASKRVRYTGKSLGSSAEIRVKVIGHVSGQLSGTLSIT